MKTAATEAGIPRSRRVGFSRSPIDCPRSGTAAGPALDAVGSIEGVAGEELEPTTGGGSWTVREHAVAVAATPTRAMSRQARRTRARHPGGGARRLVTRGVSRVWLGSMAVSS